MGGAADGLELDDLTSRVLDCVDLIPPGRVTTYGDIAALVGTGPRQVGRIMALHGHLAAWWRVVRADGGSQVSDRARPRWDEEGITYTRGARVAVRMAHHRLTDDELQAVAAQLSPW